MEYVQGEASVTGRFSFTLSWDPSDHVGEFYVDDVWLDEFLADTWIAGVL